MGNPFAAQPYGLQFNTELTDAEEQAFQEWAYRTGRTADVEDYDLRGAWKRGFRAKPGQHGVDTFKKPNHPTFSRESQYSTPQRTGGDWVKAPDGTWLYFASPENMNHQSAEQLRNYFSEAEPGNRVIPALNTKNIFAR